MVKINFAFQSKQLIMSYKQTLERGDEGSPEGVIDGQVEVPLTEKAELETEVACSAEEETDYEDRERLLIADSDGIKTRGVVLLTADELFERDSWKHRYTRRFLVLSGLGLLLGLFSAAIAMIAIAPSCPSTPGSEETSCELLWWQREIIYQCYPRSFQDSDGDGNGDLNGIRSRLDYFVDINIGAVWLNPIYLSPLMDNGYDISNYTDIDPLYGTMKDFKDLLEDMHEKGLKMILDFIPNHSSEQHPWFKESRSRRNNSKRDWYIWADGKGEGPPNNWISVFGGSAWTYDNLTEQYYFHQYGYFQPDLNYRNPEVQEAMKDVLRFWLDLGVDGFRVDAASFLLEDAKLENESGNPSFRGTCNCSTNISSPDCYNSLVHNLTTNYEGIHDIIRSWRQVLDSYSDSGRERFMVGEVYDPISEGVTYYGKHNDEFNFAFNFALLKNTNWIGTEVSGLVGKWLNSVPEGAWSNWVLGCHDSPRISSKAGVYLARALNVLLLTLPGTPTTYYGEEILMTDVYIPPPKRQDVSGVGRDRERTPMQWNTSAHAGFSSSTPWLPVATNYTTYNVEVETTDSLSPLTLYKNLSSFRSNHSALRCSGYDHVYNSTDVFAYLRYDNSSQLLVVINFSREETVVDFSASVDVTKPTIILSSYLNRTGGVDLENVELLGGEAVIIEGQSDL